MTVRWATLAVALVTVLAGCAALPAAETPTASGEGAVVPDGPAQSATVTSVTDGDTVAVRYPNGSEDAVRLVGIDAPEARGANSPGEFRGVPDTAAGRACLDRAADDATRTLTDAVRGEEVQLVGDPQTDRRDRYDRLLAHVLVGERNANYRLVRDGHARRYDTRFSLAERFGVVEERAREDRRGLWRCVDPDAATPSEAGDLRVRVVADAPGDDQENPNGEYVVLENAGDSDLAIENWTVTDEAGHSYAFPENATLPSGESVRIYSGEGEPNGTAFYRGNGPIWNNDGDTATVRAANGSVVARRSY